MGIDNSAWGVQCRNIGKPARTVLCYYGPGNPATGERGTGIVSKDAAGMYWCDGRPFHTLVAALFYAEENH